MVKFYVTKETAKGEVIGFNVCDRVGGLVSVHEYFPIKGDIDAARKLAADACARMNERHF